MKAQDPAQQVLDQLLIASENHLRQVLTEYLLHYNTARPHRTAGASVGR
jgi:putative transposase